MARSLWICPRRSARRAGERQEDDQGRQEDRKTDGGGDGWERGGRDGAGTFPAGALAHLPCCHTNGDIIRVGLKDGGGGLFFFPLGGVVMEGQRRTKAPVREKGMGVGGQVRT